MKTSIKWRRCVDGLIVANPGNFKLMCEQLDVGSGKRRWFWWANCYHTDIYQMPPLHFCVACGDESSLKKAKHQCVVAAHAWLRGQLDKLGAK